MAENEEMHQRRQTGYGLADALQMDPHDKFMLNSALMFDRLPDAEKRDVLDAAAARWAAKPPEANVSLELCYGHLWTHRMVEVQWVGHKSPRPKDKERRSVMNEFMAHHLARHDLPEFYTPWDWQERADKIQERLSTEELWAGYWREYAAENPVEKASPAQEATETRKRAEFVKQLREQAKELDIAPEEVIRALTRKGGGRPGKGGGRGR